MPVIYADLGRRASRRNVATATSPQLRFRQWGGEWTATAEEQLEVEDFAPSAAILERCGYLLRNVASTVV